jgi:hypothetical protein
MRKPASAAKIAAAGLCREREDDVSRSTWMRSIGIALAVTALCAAVGGCIGDTGTSMSGAAQWPGDSPTMRYYGGPKSPMWPSQ